MSNSATQKKCKPYHHGNLHDALILAAAELIEKNDSTDFAMTDAARLAGVSSAAPYRHFKDKDELLFELSKVGFLALAEFSAQTAEKHPRGSTEQIVALGKGYIEFVTRHAQYYELMWGKTIGGEYELDPLQLKSSGFYVFADAVEAWCELSGVTGKDPVELTIKLWAMAHGLSSMAFSQHVKRFKPDADLYDLLESSTLTFLGGLKGEA